MQNSIRTRRYDLPKLEIFRFLEQKIEKTKKRQVQNQVLKNGKSFDQKSKPASQQNSKASQHGRIPQRPSTLGPSRNSKICIFRNDGEEKYQDSLLTLTVIAIWS